MEQHNHLKKAIIFNIKRIGEYWLTYPDWGHVPHFLGAGLFDILFWHYPSIVVWGIRSFDNFKDFMSQLTYCCQVFLSRFHLPATSCCLHFFIQLSLWQTWLKWQFVCSVISRLFKHNLFNKHQIICYPWSLLCISSEP